MGSLSSSFHVPVLLDETIKFLNPKLNEIFIDGTLGGGGHSEAILKKIAPGGKLVAIDQDNQAIEFAKKRLEKFGSDVVFVNANFVDLSKILTDLKIKEVDGILLDLGVSSHQLDTPERGFSFGEKGSDASLDMRMSLDAPLRAYDVVNFYPEKKLREIFFKLGEEPFGGKIARQLIKQREIRPLKTVNELLEVIRIATPPQYRFSHPSRRWASKIFRAIRMEVNQELSVLEIVLPQTLEVLKKGGRLVILSFHSLEDRIVKQKFREWEESGLIEILTPKPVIASEEEVKNNPRVESAKLRAVRKIA